MMQEYINMVDLALGSMLIAHIGHQMLIARRSLIRFRRLCGDSQMARMGYFRLLCNALFGPEEMSWTKITASVLLIVSFALLTAYGSLFGLIGILSTGLLGSAKIYYSINSKLQHTCV